MPVLAASPITKKTFRKPAPEEAPMLPKNILIGAVKYTRMVKGTGHLIPNDQIIPKLYEELGWN